MLRRKMIPAVNVPVICLPFHSPSWPIVFSIVLSLQNLRNGDILSALWGLAISRCSNVVRSRKKSEANHQETEVQEWDNPLVVWGYKPKLKRLLWDVSRDFFHPLLAPCRFHRKLDANFTSELWNAKSRKVVVTWINLKYQTCPRVGYVMASAYC